MFIVLEGIDGCGKSTQARLLYEWLMEQGKDVLLTAEPTCNRIGTFIREILSGSEKVDPKTLALLFTADRCEHLKNEIVPALSEGRIVVSERYYHSTIAYQSAQGVNREWLFDINHFVLEPTLTIFLDVKPEIAVKVFDQIRKIVSGLI
jgi:dTMP kinase